MFVCAGLFTNVAVSLLSFCLFGLALRPIDSYIAAREMLERDSTHSNMLFLSIALGSCHPQLLDTQMTRLLLVF